MNISKTVAPKQAQGKKMLPFVIGHVNFGADDTRSVPIIVKEPTNGGTNLPQGEKSSQKVLVLQGAPTCGTKKLFFDEDGNPQKSGAKQQSLFTPSQFECHDIQSLAAERKALESQRV
jgi:hypothetical protein